MFVETRRSFQKGFKLTEAELRRIIECAEEQLKKIGAEDSLRCVVKYRNGVVAETESIESVFSQENMGSSQIITLELFFGIKNDDIDGNNADTNGSGIVIKFRNVDFEINYSSSPIVFYIRSADRDWVFVTSSLLAERVDKVSMMSYGLFLDRNDWIFRFAPILIMPIVIFL